MSINFLIMGRSLSLKGTKMRLLHAAIHESKKREGASGKCLKY